MSKVDIFIDGGNFYRTITAYGLHFLSFKIRDFCQSLLGLQDEMGLIRLYIGKIRCYKNDSHSAKLHAAQQKVIRKLNAEGVRIIFGVIQRTGSVYVEKGVDVQIALDLLEGAYEDKFDEAIVITSDSDLAPAFMKVKKQAKIVKSIMFTKRRSRLLEQKSSNCKILDIKWLSRFGKLNNS